jgi:hypothetical protein
MFMPSGQNAPSNVNGLFFYEYSLLQKKLVMLHSVCHAMVMVQIGRVPSHPTNLLHINNSGNMRSSVCIAVINTFIHMYTPT